MTNHRTVNVKVSRSELIDLMVACTAAQFAANDGGKKWELLHEKLNEQLKAFDKKIQ